MCHGLGRIIAGLLCVLGASAAGTAHQFWIHPASYTVRPGQPLEVRLMVGDGFPGESVRRNPARIVRFEAVGPDGAGSPVAGKDGADPAGTVTFAGPGDRVLVYRSNDARIELEAEKFEAYLRSEGMAYIIEKRAQRGERDRPGRELYSRCAKALVRVADPGERASSGLVPADREVGLRYELVIAEVVDDEPSKDGARIVVRAVFDARPLANAQVCAMSPREPGKHVCVTTGADGRATIEVPWSGMIMLSSVTMTEAAAGSDAEWESTWSSLTLDLPGGAAEPRSSEK